MSPQSKQMKSMEVRLDMLPLFLETKEIISPTIEQKPYWSKWVDPKTNLDSNEQEQNLEREKYWIQHVNDVQGRMETFLNTLSSENPIFSKAISQTIAQKCFLSDEKSLTKTYPTITQQRHYFDACAIMETLIQEDKSGKNLFGQYKDPLLTKFHSFLDDYKKGGVHLAQAISLLSQTFYFDLPSIQKDAEELESQIRAIDRTLKYKEMECSEVEKKWSDECHHWGIQKVETTPDIDNEVSRLSSQEWGAVCQEIQSKFSNGETSQDKTLTKEAMLYYQRFISFLTNETDAKNDTKLLLPSLNEILTNIDDDKSLLQSSEFRTQLVIEMNELNLFLRQRQAELSNTSGFHSFVPTTPSKTPEEIQTFGSKIQTLLDCLHNGKLLTLSEFVNNVEYRQHLVTAWKSQFGSIQQIKHKIRSLEKEKEIIVKNLDEIKQMRLLCSQRANHLKIGLEKELQVSFGLKERTIRLIHDP